MNVDKVYFLMESILTFVLMGSVHFCIRAIYWFPFNQKCFCSNPKIAIDRYLYAKLSKHYCKNKGILLCYCSRKTLNHSYLLTIKCSCLKYAIKHSTKELSRSISNLQMYLWKILLVFLTIFGLFHHFKKYKTSVLFDLCMYIFLNYHLLF